MADLEKTLYSDIAQLLEQARKHVRRATNSTMVYTYYEIGKRIVEEEQRGQDRAEYGAQIIKGLSDYLTQRFGRGFSTTNLKQMRQFYRVYSADEVRQTLFTESAETISQTPSDQLPSLSGVAVERTFRLSWSHYLKLMRISNSDERHFYEIEAARNNPAK